jgi:AraC-like DNA-binding protein
MLLFIKLHYDEKLEVDDIAASAGISRSECFRCFRNQLSKKPIEFLNEYRLQQAAVKLKSTTKSICEIAQECGFVHQSYFGKQFKAFYHVTPAEYRKKLY